MNISEFFADDKTGRLIGISKHTGFLRVSPQGIYNVLDLNCSDDDTILWYIGQKKPPEIICSRVEKNLLLRRGSHNVKIAGSFNDSDKKASSSHRPARSHAGRSVYYQKVYQGEFVDLCG